MDSSPCGALMLSVTLELPPAIHRTPPGAGGTATVTNYAIGVHDNYARTCTTIAIDRPIIVQPYDQNTRAKTFQIFAAHSAEQAAQCEAGSVHTADGWLPMRSRPCVCGR